MMGLPSSFHPHRRCCCHDLSLTHARACKSHDRCSQHLVPEKFPSVSHFDVTIALIEAAKQFKLSDPSYNFQVGLCQSIGFAFSSPFLKSHTHCHMERFDLI